MTRRLGLGLALVCGALMAIQAARVVRFKAATRATLDSPPDGFTRALVAIHLHTSASADARGTLDELVAAAAAAGLQAIIVTDHDAFLAREQQGYRADGPAPLLVIGGAELGTDDGHLLALGIGREELAYRPSYETAQAIEDVTRAGGLAVAAHPVRPHGTSLGFRARPEERDGLTGIEIANLDSAWRGRRNPLAIGAALAAYPLAPSRAIALLAAPEARALELYDAELARRAGRPLAGLAGSDAHGGRIGYGAALGALANVVLLEQPLAGDARADRSAILEALASGRVLVAYTALADPRGASFLGYRAASGGASAYPPGSRIPAGADVELYLASGLERAADLRILHDGHVVARGRGRELRHRTREPGAYRAEIRLDGPFAVPWLLSGAIVLAPGSAGADGNPSSSAAARPVRGRSAAPGREGAPASLIEALAPESDAGSRIEIQEPYGARGPGTPLVARFELGRPRAGEKDVWCALVARDPRDLRGHEALTLVGSADRELRVDVALTLRGVRYRRSLLLTPTTRAYHLPLASFRSSGAKPVPMPGSALGPYESLLVGVDLTSAWPGASGVLRLESLALR